MPTGQSPLPPPAPGRSVSGPRHRASGLPQHTQASGLAGAARLDAKKFWPRILAQPLSLDGYMRAIALSGVASSASEPCPADGTPVPGASLFSEDDLHVGGGGSRSAAFSARSIFPAGNLAAAAPNSKRFFPRSFRKYSVILPIFVLLPCDKDARNAGKVRNQACRAESGRCKEARHRRRLTGTKFDNRMAGRRQHHR